MSVVPRLVRRSYGILDLSIKNRSGIQAYRLSAAKDLDTAYTAPTAFLTVRSGDIFSSPTIKADRTYRMDSSNKGLTRLWLCMDDYASATIPGDGDVSFIVVEEQNSAGVFLPAGPILVIPPPDFFETGRRNLVINGNAPNLPSRGNYLPPEDGLRVAFPKFADELSVYNEEATGGGNDLYFSLGLGLQEMRVRPEEVRVFAEAGANEVILRGAGGAVWFSISAAIVNGIQA